MKKIIYIICSVAVAVACSKTSAPEVEPAHPDGYDPFAGWALVDFDGTVESYVAPKPPFEYMMKYNYEKADFCSPERGSTEMFEYHFRGGTIPSVYSVERLKSCHKLNCTLHYLGVYLCDYVESDIPQAALDMLREHFRREREAGNKVVLRHAYSWGDKSDKMMEPTLPVILRHIEQLAPIWNEFKDVIYVIQAGFVGVYGEWHTTTNITTDEQKAQIVKAMLDAAPKDREIAMRTPGQKRMVMKYIDGAYSMADSVTCATAYDGSYNSRLTNHNDCYFANSNDGGTYGGSADKRYLKRESNYLIVGGESCFVGDYTYCECRYANQHLRDFHVSYLRIWNEQIADYWKENKCHTDLTSRVGYRFVLNGSAFYGHFTAGGKFLVKLCLTNYGFAALANERKLEFILRNDNDHSEKYVFVSEKDPREWKGCHHYEYDETLTLPETLKAGETYTLFLNLPDIAENLHDNPAYSVRFANTGVWEESTGYNKVASFRAE